ncbi:MAG: ATP-binding cassette domain-containing protein [Rhizobiales bacterium]|nr:ATP-binding cassette domain-containing protein [Hyphomicrobiales bacterium]NRB14499.1 ATP-binding cassette domain-containing protein [Hyphomicrobiales bacterium]
MIEIKNLSKSLGNKQVLKDIAFNLPKGGISSIIGPNGAGKSTLLCLMARLLSLDSGSVAFDGLDIAKTRDDTLAKKISILTQSNAISSRLSVEQLVMFGRFPHHRGRPRLADEEFVTIMLELMELTDIRFDFIDELSGGQQQRAFIAMILAQDTDYILLDEPLNNLDMKHARNIMKTLKDVADNMNKTIILVIHDINFAAHYSDYFIGLKQGEIIVRGDVDTVLTQSQIKLIYDIDVSINIINNKKHIFYYS